MAEVEPTASTASSAAGTRTGNGFELRLERGGAHVRLGAPTAIAGLLVEHLDLRVPEIALPFDAGGGPTQFRQRLCDLDALTVLADAAAVTAAASRLDLGELGLGALEVALRDGFAEAGGRLASGVPFSMRLGLLPGFERGVTVVPYAPRIYGPASVPAAALPHLAARALSALGLPDDPLPLLARRLLVSRGWKVPREGGVRLSAATVAPGGVRLAWTREAMAPPPPPGDADLLAAVEGARAFAEMEAMTAAGDWAAAREAWLSSAAPTTHAFAADRLLSLLCIDERFHDEALDLTASWLQRRPGFAPALAAEAWIRSLRGEQGRAAVALVALAEGSAAAGERLAAVIAADAVLALPGVDRDLLARAVDAALAARRDHLPALRALRALARERGDKGAQVRAARRVLAHAPTDLEKARAHAELGELLLEGDPPGARLHLDRALRLAPDDAESLSALARACTAAGEHLRAVGALDRLFALRQRAGDLGGAVALALEAGAIWEQRLGHAENALVRYREAAELGPRAAEAHRLAAGCAERLGRWSDAADHHASALAVLDRSAPGAGALATEHHLALADVAEHHLDDPAGAATHLEAAQASGTLDLAHLTRLVALQRRLGRPAPLLHALERLAALTEPPAVRAALLAEAGDLARGPLGRPEVAASRYAEALQLDATSRPAIEGLAALALARGDGPGERDALLKLVPLARDRGEEAAILDRLAAACARAGDLSAAARAVGAARRADPSRERLAAAVALARQTGDLPELAALLADQARSAAAAGARSAAAAAWRERTELLADRDPALALSALDEARGLDPGDPGLLRLEATLAERIGDHHRALGALRTQLASGPPDAGALELRAARAALAAGESGAAVAHAERALAAGQRDATDVLVAALERGGNGAGQVEALGRAGRHLEAASLAERLGDGLAARRALERAGEVRETAGEALRQLLRLHAAAGDAPAAAATLLAAARRAGGREGAQLAWRAWTLTGDEAALAATITADPAFAPARAERAQRRAAADASGALSDAEAALAGDELDPARRPELLRLAARLAEQVGNRELARRRLSAFCQTGSPGDAELARLAELHRAANDLDGLAAVLARRLATASQAEVPRLRLELASLLSGLGREPEAVAAWRGALERDPAALEPLQALLAGPRSALLHDGERERLLRVLAVHPGVPEAEQAGAWDAVAVARDAAGDDPGGREARAAAARLRGEDGEGLERRALAALAAGDQREAARLHLQRARLALAGGEPGAAERLVEAGLSLVEAGDAAGGEATLREALLLRPEPERARAALTALVARAEARSDAPAEIEALSSLVPLVPTGERPERLIRLSALRATSGDLGGALEAAEQARRLAPRTLAAVRQARLAAAAAGDEPAVVARLAEEAELEPAGAGTLLLDRARRLARLGEAAAADDAFTESLRLLPPDQGLALEQTQLRRAHLPARPPSEPLERLASRLEDPAAAARAQAAAAALAWEAGDGGAALRCARRAFGRSRQTPSLAGPLLARLLYAQGSFAEALVVHRSLLELGFPGFEEGEVVTLCRQLAELAGEAEDGELAKSALDRLLALRPQETGAALERFRIDPDRARAVAALEAVAGQVRSQASRIELLATAAEGALAELRDQRLGARLFREARAEAALTPGLPAALEWRGGAATRLGELGPEALLGALHDAAEAARAGGDLAAARGLLQEAVAEQRARGMKAGAARDLLALEELLAAQGAEGAAAGRAREAAELLAESGDPSSVSVMRRALARDPGFPDGLRRLADLEARFDPAAAELTLRRALAEVPDDPSFESALLALLDREGREGARARVLLDRARRRSDPAERAAFRREAARLLATTGDSSDASLAADALLAVTSDLPGDGDALRAAAEALMAAGRRTEAVPLLAGLLRTRPGDTALAEELERAGGPGRQAPAAESIEDALSSGEELHEAGQEPATGPRTLEFPAMAPRTLEFPVLEPQLLEPLAEPPASLQVSASPAVAPEPEPVPEPVAAPEPVPEQAASPEPEPAPEPAPVASPELELELELEPKPDPVPAPAFEPIVGPRTLELPAMRLPIEEPAPVEPPGSAHDLASLSGGPIDGATSAASWLASARALRQAGAAADEVRQAIEAACEAEPDAVEPWAALAALELEHGDVLAAARAHLAVSIRTEGRSAAAAALEAARLFLEQGRLPEAVRALRAATLGEASAVPRELVQAAEALATGWREAAAALLSQLPPEGLPEQAEAIRDHLQLMVDWNVGVSEISPAAPPEAGSPPPEPALAPPPAEAAPPVIGSGAPEPGPADFEQPPIEEAAMEAVALEEPAPAAPPLAEGSAHAVPALDVELGIEPEAGAGLVAGPVDALEPEPERTDPVLLHLRALAEAATGPERAASLERLAGLLERSGQFGAAADALIQALEADPERDLTWGWLDSLVAGDPAREARVVELRRSAPPLPAMPLPLEPMPELQPSLELLPELPAALDLMPELSASFELPPEPPLPPGLPQVQPPSPVFPPARPPLAAEHPTDRLPASRLPPLPPPAPPAEALERALAAARRNPADLAALVEVAELAAGEAAAAPPSDRDRLAELGRLAASIAFFVAPDRMPVPEAPPPAAALSEAARDRVALPGTIGPLGKLLSLLAPHLEPLFPADLQRRGVTATSRLAPPQVPEARVPLESAASLLQARPHALFLVERPGAAITSENTQPPALIIPTGFTALPLAARRFLALRALDQLERGWALVGKFAPRDVGILLELACRFAGGQPPPLGLPAGRAGAFLSAMARGVPPVLAARVASLGPAAAEELARLDLGSVADELERTSARVALLATGDPAGAFAALLAADPAAGPRSGAEALELPALRELAELALSDPFLDLRVAVVS